jgi:CDP-diacylglycerol--glycerol-3-phosphate 3-phosphatidyltransferase
MLYLQKGNMQKLIRWFAGSWMTANQATFFGVIFILLTSASFYLGLSCPHYRFLLILTPVFLFLRMVMNALDGLLAREYKTGSVAGELWNEGLDVIGDMVCYGSLYFIPNPPILTLTLFLMLAWTAEFFGVLGKGLPGGIRQHVALLGGKPDRATWMGLLGLLLFFIPNFVNYLPYYLLFISFFVLVTVILRIRKILHDAKGKQYKSYTWIGK